MIDKEQPSAPVTSAPAWKSWSEADVAVAVEAFHADLSASKTAEKLRGKSRSAVISLWNRMGLKRREAGVRVADVVWIWTDEAVQVLKARRAAGDSYGEIAAVLGCTRDQVLGKSTRLGLRGPFSPTDPARAPARPRSELRARAQLAPQPPEPPQPKPRPIRPPVEEADAPIADAGVSRTVVTLRYGECRWPIAGDRADTVFCCAPVLGESSWCPEHRRKAVTGTVAQLKPRGRRDGAWPARRSA